MPQVQPSGTPFSFVFTTHVRSDIIAPPTVNTIVHPIPAARAPILQIPIIASIANSQQVAPLIQVTADPCRKCGKKNHPTDRCHSKVTCKNCKGKDHGTRFCTVATTTAGYNCMFCRKSKHPIENYRIRMKPQRRTQMRATDLDATSETSNVS